MIQFYNEGVEMPVFDKTKTKSFIKHLAEQYGKKVGEIGYKFCTDESMLEANQKFLQHDYYTDILTFDYSDDKTISGDILISLDTVRSNAEKFGVDFKEELRRVIFHGILHLCGIDDKSEAQQAQMRTCEEQALKDFEQYL